MHYGRMCIARFGPFGGGNRWRYIGGGVHGGRYRVPTYPPPLVNRQTAVKTLPSRNFVGRR